MQFSSRRTADVTLRRLWTMLIEWWLRNSAEICSSSYWHVVICMLVTGWLNIPLHLMMLNVQTWLSWTSAKIPVAVEMVRQYCFLIYWIFYLSLHLWMVLYFLPVLYAVRSSTDRHKALVKWTVWACYFVTASMPLAIFNFFNLFQLTVTAKCTVCALIFI